MPRMKTSAKITMLFLTKEDVVLTGPSLHYGLTAPAPASQAFVPGGAVRAATAKRTIMLRGPLAKSYSTSIVSYCKSTMLN